METVAIIIVSDGKITNHFDNYITKYMISELDRLHYEVKKITVLCDNINSIHHELELLISQYDIQIIIGGIKTGIIYKVLAKLLSEELKTHLQLSNILQAIEEPFTLNEITIPLSSKVLSVPGNIYPIIYVQRIFVLNPTFLQDTFSKLLKPHLEQYNKKTLFKLCIKINDNGNGNYSLQKVDKFSNHEIQLDIQKNENFITFSCSSFNLNSLMSFRCKIQEEFKISNYKYEYDWNIIYTKSDPKIEEALYNINECFKQYGPENVFICFNGGKDCTVLLHLVLAVSNKYFPHHNQPQFCLYVQSESPFPEQEEFIENCQQYYNLEVMVICSDIKNALNQVLTKNPNFKACLMGTRRTDPFSVKLNVFQLTDPDWPQIMRVSPLLDWHYCDIWDYLLYYKVPYCKLYDMGFTSLGNTCNTIKNPSLVYYNVVEEKEMYLPAFKLLKESKERYGRSS